MMELRGVQKRYPGRFLLDIPELTILPSSRTALIGANGSGKTTLIRILAGTLAPDAGTVLATGLCRTEIGYLPQTPHTFDLTVLQNAMLGAAGDLRINRIKAARAVLHSAGLDSLADARARSLSGGERQRLALCRLMARPHKLLLLDEPTASMDVEAANQMESALAEYCATHGCALVFSTHAPGQALRLAGEAIMLSEGQMIEQGAANDVLCAPKNEGTQTFLRYWRGKACGN